MSRFILSLLFLSFVACSGQDDFERSVREAVTNQMNEYPKSTLRDLYKNFFQDRFGPGHLIADTAAAAAYLREELASFEQAKGAAYEPTGRLGNFYRVNLSVVKDAKVPAERLLDAFVRSANNVVAPTPDEWRKEWRAIDRIIRSMQLYLPNEEADHIEIKIFVDSGNYVMHHSSIYEETYEPHYRIVEKTIFEQEILPLIN